MTLDCVGITQFSVMRISHRNDGLKCFFYFPKFFVIIVSFGLHL